MPYSLNALKTATGAGTASLSACKGNTTGPIAMSSFTATSVNSISGYTYVVENTSEDYELLFSGEAANFNRIKITPANFTWAVTAGTYISIGASPNYIATITAADMNPQNPSAQSSLMTVQSNTLCCTFADGYNTTITNYNIQLCKTVYSVDSYDGNATSLCLLADSPIIMSDGEIIEAGDLVEGDKLMGYEIFGIPPDDDFDYLNWSTDDLHIIPKEVTLVNITYSFAKRYYSINDGEVRATYEHPMLVFDEELNKYTFKEVFKIKVGDSLIKGFGENYQEIEVYKIEIVDDTLEIVSLDVESQDTYLVNGYITHNKGGNTHTDLTAPAQVTGLAYSAPNLSWTAVSGADSYELQVDDVNTFVSPAIDTNVGTATSWDVSALSDGTWYARVRAVDHGLTGSWSTTLSFSIVSTLDATGGSITYANIGGTDYKIHTFTTSGTFTVTQLGPGTVDVLVVAGGGGGGGRHGGGGGGGGVVYDNARSVTTTSYTVTIGAGGPHLPVAESTIQRAGGPGGNSSFDTLVANGGGGGGSYTDAGSKNGGSGGGGGASSYTAAGVANQGASTGDVGYGNNGGLGGTYGAGGGGAGVAGQSYSAGQDGGDGIQLNWTGTLTYYAGGGGGGHGTNGSTNPGGAGGGGTGAYNYPTQGTDGLGGGGGGSRSGSYTLGNAVSGAVGGSGVVIIKYPY